MILELVQAVENYEYKFINDIFKSNVKKILNNLLPNLNNYDMNIILQLTLYMIEDISTKYNFPQELGFMHWLKNNGRDISSIALTLIPYIGDNNYDRLTKLTDIIYSEDTNAITNKILELDRNTAIKKYFSYSNFSLGLLNNSTEALQERLIEKEQDDEDEDENDEDTEDENKVKEEIVKPEDNIVLDLYKTGQHSIYHCIENNFISMLETIKITNGKLFVNWLNIIPLVDYKKSYFYKTSIEEMNELNKLMINNTIPDIKLFWNIIKKNKGLWLGDYYNVYANGYYNSMKSLKWLIFCSKVDNKYYYMIQYLTYMINTPTIFKYNDYDSISNIEKNIFNNSLKKWIYSLKNNIAIYKNINFEIDIIKNLLTFMASNYSKLFLLEDDIKNFFKFNTNYTLEDIELTDKKLSLIKKDTIISALITLNPKYLWEYLKETIELFQSTPYAKYLIENNKINMKFFNLIDDDNSRINLKNIYNIAKTLSHDNINSNYTFLGSNFKSLDDFYQPRFFSMFANTSIQWLNIKKNIKIQEIDNYDYNDILIKIGNAWNKIKVDLVWEYLNDNGLLSYFNINLELTDTKTFISTDTNEKNRMIKRRLKTFFNENKEIFNCNYFMTNKPYNNNYIKLLTESLVFYTFYANDWISQLNFFNHYINHSVLFITGSTGTGKSTQIPKLTLYALKMYDYKNTGSIVCTQPRIPPTQDNAIRIAKEMGLDIIEVKNNIEYKTDLYYIQFKHKKNNHLKKYINHLTLKMVTDGTLVEELIKNPTLKNQYNIKKTESTFLYKIGMLNKYDVVMVDEAHEHNTNMDIILTLMRQTCMMNNSIRLIIISATMDDDEPIYRSYYKLINDNIVFPIKQPLNIHPILDDKYFIDSYYLDRRIHISIPKFSYSYKITEYYDEEIEKRFTTDMRNNALIAQEKAYDIIRMICAKSIFGDILLFSIGEQEIKTAVDTLNRIIPANTIALPFYSKMNSKYRDIISDINNKIQFIRNKKDNITTEWGEDYIDIKDVPQGTYKRAIIVATNVAEASITIESLRYVVDTGFAKVNRYDVSIDASEINIEHISESSRIQRKGRIGRVAEGTVYYIYGKNTRLNVKPKYGITLGDFHQNFIKLARKYVDDSNILMDINPYIYQYYNDTNVINTNVYKFNIIDIITLQYLILLKPLSNTYFYPFNELQSNVLPKYLTQYPDGFTTDVLKDSIGKFYIIHPYEDILTRNINNNIIKVDNIITNSINDKLFNRMMFNMEIKLQYLSINNNYYKTIYYDKINEVVNILGWEEKEANIILLMAGYDLLYEGCEIITMLKIINNNPISLMKIENKIIKYDEMLSIFGSDSDITSIYNICKLLRNTLNNMYIFNVYKKSNIIELFKNKYISILNEYNRKNYNAILKSLNIMNNLYNSGNLNLTTGFLQWLKSSREFKKYLIDNISSNSNNIYKFCEQYYLNYNIIYNYLIYLVDNIINILTADVEFDEEFDEISPFKWVNKISSNMMKIITKNTVEEKLNLCFFLAQPLYFAVLFGNDYITMSTNKCTIKPFIQNKLNTLCTNIGGYIGYYNYSNNNISIIYNINIYNISSYYPIYYNTNNIKNTYYSNITEKIYQFNSTEWNNLIANVANTYSNLAFDRFPLNNPEFPNIQEYIKEYKFQKKKNT